MITMFRSSSRSRHGSRAGRSGARVLAALAVLCSMLSLPLAGQGAAAETPPSIFDIRVDAAPFVNELAAVTVIPLPLGNGVARSSVSMNSQPFVISQAAVAYSPLGETLLAAEPEAARLAFCTSYFPTGPGNPGEASCGGGGVLPGDVGVEAGSGHTVTTGEADDPTTLVSESSARGVGVSGAAAGLPAAVTVGSVSSAAVSKAVDDRMTAAGSTALDDIEIAGVLTIRSIRSTVSGALSGEAGGSAAEQDLNVAGATVAGQPVEIDEEGVHAVGQPPTLVPGRDQAEVDEALAAAGVRVALVPAPEPTLSDDGTKLQASSGTLRIDFDNFQTGVLTRFDLGTANLVMQASRSNPMPAVTPTGADMVAAPDADAGAAPELPGRSAPGLSTPSGTRASAPAPPAAPQPGASAGSPTREVTQVALTSGPVDDWDLAYVPFALMMLALPFALSARRSSIPSR